MVNYITDGSLVGFWPLDEPSGTPIWKNHSAAFARYPSGVPFDFTVAVADVNNIEEYMSVWPGKGLHVNPESGTTYTGYQVQGSWRMNTDSSPLSRYLVLGGGARQCAEQIWEPLIAQSGFTVGYWVYPNSDGYENFQTTAGTFTGTSWYTEAARCHTLIGAFQANTANGGWRLGISGIRSRGAQFNFNELSSKQLRAFSFIERTTGAPSDLLSVPIESGRYTHVAFSYRYVNGTINEVVLYKDGRVTASGTTTANLTSNNTSLISTSLSRSLAIGPSDDTTTATDDYERTSGWNHFVSGVYFFKRVLHEGEILDIHQQGGLQPTLGNLLPAVETNLTSNYLVAYYPFMEPGYGDISKNHRAAISNFDAGDHTECVLVPGPHGFGTVFNNGVNTSNYYAIPSGACYEMLNARSWTIAAWIDLQNAANRDDNIWLSWGSSTNATNAALQVAAATALTLNTAGLVGTVSGITNLQRAVVEVYPRGNIQDGVNNITFNLLGTYEYYNQASMHIAIAYDDSTRGMAIYLNGALSESGTLNHSLTDQLLRITGSGFPLLFGNAVQDSIADATTKGLFTTGGLGVFQGPVLLAKKALVGPEVRGIALSGVSDIPRVFRTRHDPRLVGYWPCTTFKMDDVIVLDEAMAWCTVPGNLVRGDTFGSDERWYDKTRDESPVTSVYRADGTAFINHFGTRTLPSELSSYGNLGITSGIFAVNGGSLGTALVDDADNARSSVSNLSARYKPVIEERDLIPQNIAGEYVVSFEVTPSGRIPAIDIVRTATTNEINTNCVLFSIGNSFNNPGAGDSEFQIFLTTLNSVSPDPLGATAGLGGSGVTIRVDGQADTFTAANYAPLVSGRVPFGVPSRVLVHGKFDDPYSANGLGTGTANYTISLWINGTLIQRLTRQATTARVWSAGTPDSADYAPICFGGALASDTLSAQANWHGGLGDIYMREIFIMRGAFHKDEIQALATSGIQSPTIAGYVDQNPTTQVTIADSTLKAYWRFNGFAGGGSGTTDVSGKGNHLFPAAQRYQQFLGANGAAAVLRFFPAMFANSDLGVQCSGVSYSDVQTGAAPNRIAPFMASGSVFNDPNAGFSIGFFKKRKDITANGRSDVLIAYGIVPAADSNATVNYNYGWCIETDSVENVKMVMAKPSGNMLLDGATVSASRSGQIECGVFGEGGRILDDLRPFERQNLGDHAASRLDAWTHYCWTFNPTDKYTRCYMNGQLVDMVDSPSGVQIPILPSARYLTFFLHSQAPWVFDNVNTNDYTTVMTDVFYFTRALDEPEVRYIALNGIDTANGTETSGIIGGYIHGSNLGSGLIGGYSRGLEYGSGLIGGFVPGGTLGSGLIGGYVSGIIFATDTIGGFARGLDYGSGIIAGYIVGANVGSGMIAGYIHGTNTASGLIGGYVTGGFGGSGTIGGFIFANATASGLVGGFIIGGLQGSMHFDTGFVVEAMSAKDFDAQLEIAKTTSADFDAKLVIFQDESVPLVNIIIPSTTVTGLVPPFNQYFIGVASGQQGKTITQTKWNFGDFTPTVSVSESGAGFYPTQHRFTQSGIMMVKFSAIDSNGLHNSAIRIINIASGVTPIHMSISGVPRSGSTALTVDFQTRIETVPNNVSVITQLLDFDDGQSTTSFNPVHSYSEPGIFKPVWIIRDSRNVIWSDTLESGSNN